MQPIAALMLSQVLEEDRRRALRRRRRWLDEDHPALPERRPSRITTFRLPSFLRLTDSKA